MISIWMSCTYFGVIKLSYLGGLYSPILTVTSYGAGYFLSKTISFLVPLNGENDVTFPVTFFWLIS